MEARLLCFGRTGFCEKIVSAVGKNHLDCSVRSGSFNRGRRILEGPGARLLRLWHHDSSGRMCKKICSSESENHRSIVLVAVDTTFLSWR